MIKAIIFDFYGVISSDDYHDWLDRHGLSRGGDFKKAIVDMNMGFDTANEFFGNLSKLSGLPAEEIRSEFSANSSLNRELIALILQLKKSYKIALMSNASSQLKEILKDAGIDKLFDEIIISSDIGLIKPDKKIFDYALNKLAIKPEQSVFIDDKEAFVEAANNCGIKGIYYSDFASLLRSFKLLGIIGN